MKRYFLLMGLLIILGGCAFGIYDDRGYFQGAAIAVPYAYSAPSHPSRVYGGNFYRHGYRYYSHGTYRYYRGPRDLGYYR